MVAVSDCETSVAITVATSATVVGVCVIKGVAVDITVAAAASTTGTAADTTA